MENKARKAYDGATRKLLLAFDIGTTFSGISYSVLDPGTIPEILPVTRYPSQGKAGGDSKIPTIIYYDKDGKPVATGAETLKEGIEIDAEEEGWQIARWFKLHLRPKSAIVPGEEPVPPLPCGKTVVQVFTDFITYLHNCAEKFITETHGAELYSSMSSDIIYVLTHPNGWAGPQHTAMRLAATLGGLVPNTPEGAARVIFVTEGEASLHFCLSSGLKLGVAKEKEDKEEKEEEEEPQPPKKKVKLTKAAAAKAKAKEAEAKKSKEKEAEKAKEETGVLIVDAGGGTVDVTSYSQQPDGSYIEIAIPECYFQGSAYVTMRAKSWFTNLLKATRFEEDVDTLTQIFDRTTKLGFRKDDQPYHIQFASNREKEPALNIRAGRLKLEGPDVALFFKPSIDCIVNAVKKQSAASRVPIRAVFLVGGFSASEWLFSEVKDQLEPLGTTVSIPDRHINKAVASGAVSFYLDSLVSSRVARSTYGTETHSVYNLNHPDHVKRGSKVFLHPITRQPMLAGQFSVILPKGTQVRSTEEFKYDIKIAFKDREQLRGGSMDIISYTGESKNPRWIDDEPGKYTTVCRVEGDLSKVAAPERMNPDGEKFGILQASIVLLFGMTELKAQLSYMEDGLEKRGPASVIFAGGLSAFA
ncbi:hypothetical protein DFP72DRAFT_555314 [Ephemerocybe angulata]|uniref:Actin-like ATPase domain-containing protein n=1 Tax=Ephemerocybe angulata TaxID=980116 RepID=A0A8H6M0D6_9AGAR|nr:hypothetical protein DFP72DRAFT_555314 [Tulosesus angulatus]